MGSSSSSEKKFAEGNKTTLLGYFYSSLVLSTRKNGRYLLFSKLQLIGCVSAAIRVIAGIFALWFSLG